MKVNLPTEEAKSQNLPGSDVYQYTHLLYHDELNRDFGVVRLNIEAIKALTDTVTVSKRHAIAAEQVAIKQWMAAGGFESGLDFPWGNISIESMEYSNYEHLKIASAFELHLKARLLARGYILHEIDGGIAEFKQLAAEQRGRPVRSAEVFAIRPYHFNGMQNYLPGLKESSLKFSWLTEKASYRAVLDLSAEQVDIINDYRLLRNQIHFPGDTLHAIHIQEFPRPIVEFLIEFINVELVAWSNALIAKHSFNFAPLALLS